MEIGINSDENLPLLKTLNIKREIIFTGPIFSHNYYHYRHEVRLANLSYRSAEQIHSMLITILVMLITILVER